MPKNFFELSDDEADDIVAERFSLPTDMKVKRAKRPAKAPAKRVSVKRVSARRVSAKRGSVRRASPRRASLKPSVRRGSRRRSSRPLVGLFGQRRAAAPIPRPATGNDATAERTRDATRAVLAAYIQWIDSADPNKMFHHLVSITNDVAYITNVALTAARNARDRKQDNEAEVLEAAIDAAIKARALGNMCIPYARVARRPSEEERKKLQGIYTVVGEALQRAYDRAEKMPTKRPAGAPELRPLSVKEMVDELDGLRMEERLKGLGGPSKDGIDVGPPPERAPYLSGGGRSEMGAGWTELLKFVPQTVNQLGIAHEVADGTFAKRWLGSGAYATAFSMPDSGYVLKMTTDPEDAFISMKLAEASRAGQPPLGLIRTFVVFRIQLPFKIETRLSGQVNKAYGMVTERAITLTDYKSGERYGGDKSARNPLIAKAVAETGMSRGEAEKLLHETFEKADAIVSGALRGYDDGLTFGDYLSMVHGRSHVVEGFRAGVAWCAARGLNFGSDAHHGNFAIVWRNARFEAVKSDLGHYSVEKGKRFAIEEVSKLPLASNTGTEREDHEEA